MRWILYVSLAYGLIFGVIALINALGWGVSPAYRLSNAQAPIGIVVGAGVSVVAAISAAILVIARKDTFPAWAVRTAYVLGAVALAACVSTLVLN